MSGRKNVLKSYHALNAGSMGASVTSTVTDGTYQDSIGIQVTWTSSNAVGVITVDASINYDPRLGTGDWIALTFSPALSQPASNNGSYLIDLQMFPFPYYRVSYTRTSGTGTLDVWFCSKEI